jgi:TonB family protein
MMGVPSSRIFAAAESAQDASGKTNGARPSSSSLTPSVEMAPLVEATLDEIHEDEVDDDLEDEGDGESAWAAARNAAAEEAVTVPRKPEPAPPAVAKEAPKEKAPPPTRKWEPTQKVDPMPVTPELRASGELPMGTFNYPVQKRSGGGALKWLLFLFVLGAGFGSVVFVAPKLMKKDDATPSAQVAETTTPTPPSPTPAPPPAGSAEQPTTETTPPTTEAPPTTTPTTTTTPPTNTETPATNTTTTRTQPTTTTRTTKRGGTTPGPVTAPDKGTPPTNTTNTTTTTTEKPVETKPPPSTEPGCDEVACVLSKYDRPCCERYKPAQSDISKRSGSIPEDLDRAAVRSGMEKVKPAVVACGEKTGAKGTVKIAVTVAPEGNVTSSEVAESPDSGLGSCVAAAIKRASFSKSVNGGSFTYPFVF